MRHPGRIIFMLRWSHHFFWLPHPYRHCSGGIACHWLWFWGVVGERL